MERETRLQCTAYGIQTHIFELDSSSKGGTPEHFLWIYAKLALDRIDKFVSALMILYRRGEIRGGLAEMIWIRPTHDSKYIKSLQKNAGLACNCSLLKPFCFLKQKNGKVGFDLQSARARYYYCYLQRLFAEGINIGIEEKIIGLY